MRRTVLKALPHILFLSILLFLLLFPIMLADIRSPSGTYFPKIHGLLQNYYYYLSLIKLGRDSWTPINQYTTAGVVIDTLHYYYIVLGKLGKLLSISDAGMYWTGIIGAVSLLYTGTWIMVKRFIPKSYRWISMILIFFLNPLAPVTVTLGSFHVYLGAHPWTAMDFVSRISRVPHHGMGTALSLFGVITYITFFEKQKFRYALISGLLFFFASIISFLSVLIILFALCMSLIPFILKKFSFLNRKLFWGTCCITVFAVIPVIGLTMLESRTGLFSYEYALFKPNIFPNTLGVFLASALPLFIFLPLMVRFVLKVKRWDVLFLFLLFVSPFILYECSALGILPVSKQRWALYPIYTYGGLIAMMSTAHIFKQASIQTIRIVKTIIVCCVVLTTIIGVRWYYVPSLDIPLYTNVYLNREIRDAMTFLTDHTPRFSRVMSTFYIGMHIPAYTYNVVYIGHEVSTPNFWSKWTVAGDFFSGTMPADKAKQVLTDEKMDYVVWDAGPMPPSYLSFLTPVWNTTGITVYQVKK